jgi:hypothetical protein
MGTDILKCMQTENKSAVSLYIGIPYSRIDRQSTIILSETIIYFA